MSKTFTISEKINLVAAAIREMYLEREGYRSGQIEWLRQGSPLSTRQFATVCRSHLGEISALLGGTRLSYCKGEYTPSGRGAFGRLGGGNRGYYSKPCLLIG